MTDIIIFLGPPGSGKGTQSKEISNRYEYIHISSGDLLRKEIYNKTDLGLKVDNIISSGSFVDDLIVSNLVFQNIELNKRYILDGFPRHINQAYLLDSYLLNIGIQISKVIYLNIEDKDVVSRLLSRKICVNCSKEYNLKDLKFNVCPYCSSMLETRKDDNYNSIKNRLDVYNRETTPLIDFYSKKNILIKINASDTILNIYNEIVYQLNLGE